MAPSVVVVSYDPKWPEVYRREERSLRAAVGHCPAIEHVGSTAVPGLAAKPIIDVALGLQHLAQARELVRPLSDLGYEFVPDPVPPLPDCWYFHKGPPTFRLFHLHVVELSGNPWNRHIAFRDYLRSHERTAANYERLKRHLAARFQDNRPAYTNAKATFVDCVIARATAEASITSTHPHSGRRHEV